jgi:ABC-type multidrug transport system fused ATPase/permease subunit
LGYESDLCPDAAVWEALAAAQMESFVRGLPNQLETSVGERGTKLSGGQRQRLGIARALFTKPKLLVLDEATSALDGDTEVQISEAIQGLRGKVTVVMIAHRLSTVRNADLVVYMDGGEVLCTGTFEQVRTNISNFDRQAKLMGL